jgi:hypothetical protein
LLFKGERGKEWRVRELANQTCTRGSARASTHAGAFFGGGGESESLLSAATFFGGAALGAALGGGASSSDESAAFFAGALATGFFTGASSSDESTTGLHERRESRGEEEARVKIVQASGTAPALGRAKLTSLRAPLRVPPS